MAVQVQRAPGAAQSGMPWQSGLNDGKERLSALYFNGAFTDLTVTFPGKQVTYQAHRLVMAMSSPTFEGMLYGPMGISGQMLELPDDDPTAFRIVMAHCYDVTINAENLDIALNLYKLADKYLMPKLKRESARQVGTFLSPDNVNQVLEFATNYGYDELKAGCYEQLKSTYNPSMGDSSRLLSDLGTEWRTELLNTARVEMKRLSFQDSWRQPEVPLPTADLLAMMQSSSCQEQGLKYFSGCVSGDVVAHIPWAPQREGEVSVMSLSLCSSQQTNEVFSALDVNKFTGQLSIHMICNKIPPESIALPLPATRLADLPDLYISNAHDVNIPWIVAMVKAVMPPDQGYSFIKFPSCQITPNGCKNMLSCLASAQVKLRGLRMSSPHLPPLFRAELRRWINTNISDPIGITLYESDDNMDGW